MMCICLRGQQDVLLRASVSFYPHCGVSAAAEQERQKKKPGKLCREMRQTRSECARQTDNLATHFLNLFQLPAATQAQSRATAPIFKTNSTLHRCPRRPS